MPKYWIAVVSHEHVKKGVKGGFMQVCHGKGAPLKRMKSQDWIIYYSPVEVYGEKMPCRKFTAIGKIKEKEPYQFCMYDDFIPWRRDVSYMAAQETPIEPLINQLGFIKNKDRWGFPFRRGYFEISEHDFQLIADKMEISSNGKS